MDPPLLLKSEFHTEYIAFHHGVYIDLTKSLWLLIVSFTNAFLEAFILSSCRKSYFSPENLYKSLNKVNTTFYQKFHVKRVGS